MTKQFGGKISKSLIERYSLSPNWKNGIFNNLVQTEMNVNLSTMPKLLYKQLFKAEGRVPKQNIPILPFDLNAFQSPQQEVKFIWYGHSVILMQINGKTLLIDPMLGPDASPIAPFTTKRFSENALNIIDELPPIDLMLLTHDHYDHLDLASMKKLMPKVKSYYVALGTARHLESWGVSASVIKEFDWWDKSSFENIEITFTPSRHFSGRGLSDRSKSLWGGWVFKTKDQNIYFSGDGGFGDHFAEVGKKLGPFDLAFMECGQYNENWHQIHMFPSESVQAGIQSNAKCLIPVHWGGFSLAQHHWTEPVIQFVGAAKELDIKTITPKIGEIFTSSTASDEAWWEHYM